MKKLLLKDMGVIFLVTLFLLLLSTQHYPLLEPDEARYSEIPREMVSTGEYLVPHLNGIIYLEKPPLFYWLQAISIDLFGMNEGSLRLWNAIFASLTCVMVYWMGHVLYDRRTGLLAAGLLFSSLLFFAMSHFITLDMALTAFVTGSIGFLWMGLERQGAARRGYLYGSYVCAALALMTKGLVGILLPGSIFVLWMLMTRRFIELKRIYLISGLCLFFAIILPWHWMMQVRIPEFFDFYIIGQHFKRYLTLSENRYQPIWFFAPILLAGLLPWTVFSLRALWRAGCRFGCQFKANPKEAFLWVWMIFIFCFFSLSKSKLVPYILPILPPILIVLARDLWAYPRARWEWVVTLCLMLLMVIGLFVYPLIDKVRVGDNALGLMILSLILCVTWLACVFFLWRKQAPAAFGALMVGVLVVFAGAIPLWSSMADRSIKPLAIKIREMKGQYDEVVSFGKYYQDLPVYAEQTVTVVDRKGELDFGMTLEDKSAYMIHSDTFWKRWCDPHHRMLVVVSRKKFEQLFVSNHCEPVIVQEMREQLLLRNH